jgi:hypothetical protein
VSAPPADQTPRDPAELPEHPVGTFAFVGAYAVLFVIAWFAIYVLIFLARRPVTP